MYYLYDCIFFPGLWGSPDVLETSEDFYGALISMKDLLGKGYRNVAVARLNELKGSCPLPQTKIPTINDSISFFVSRSLLTVAICASVTILVNTINKK